MINKKVKQNHKINGLITLAFNICQDIDWKTTQKDFCDIENRSRLLIPQDVLVNKAVKQVAKFQDSRVNICWNNTGN